MVNQREIDVKDQRERKKITSQYHQVRVGKFATEKCVCFAEKRRRGGRKKLPRCESEREVNVTLSPTPVWKSQSYEVER